MKKFIIIPALLLATGSLLLISCGSGGNTQSMKAPEQTNADTTNENAGKVKEATEENEEKEENETEEKNSAVKPAGFATSTDAKSKTIENMQEAFKGETTATAKYAAYSKKAEQEGYHEIALLFKAASISENIHANNHKAVLQESGAAIPNIQPEFSVKTTKENLEEAIAGESYEATTMYPEFLKTANEAGNQIAMISLNYAYKTEKKHRQFYESALAALQSNSVKSLATVFYICPTCGNTYEKTAPARCGISMTSGEKFIKIISL